MDDKTISMPFAKAASSLGATGGALMAKAVELSWSEIAAMMAAIYTSLLIMEWFWKRLWRPILENRGFLKKKRVLVAHYFAETDSAPLS